MTGNKPPPSAKPSFKDAAQTRKLGKDELADLIKQAEAEQGKIEDDDEADGDDDSSGATPVPEKK